MTREPPDRRTTTVAQLPAGRRPQGGGGQAALGWILLAALDGGTHGGRDDFMSAADRLVRSGVPVVPSLDRLFLMVAALGWILLVVLDGGAHGLYSIKVVTTEAAGLVLLLGSVLVINLLNEQL